MEIGTAYRRSTTVETIWLIVRIQGDRLSMLNTRTGDIQHVDANSTLIPVEGFDFADLREADCDAPKRIGYMGRMCSETVVYHSVRGRGLGVRTVTRVWEDDGSSDTRTIYGDGRRADFVVLRDSEAVSA